MVSGPRRLIVMPNTLHSNILTRQGEYIYTWDMRKPVSFTLLEATREALERIAEKTGESKSQMVESLIHEAEAALAAVDAAQEGAE